MNSFSSDFIGLLELEHPGKKSASCCRSQGDLSLSPMSATHLPSEVEKPATEALPSNSFLSRKEANKQVPGPLSRQKMGK